MSIEMHWCISLLSELSVFRYICQLQDLLSLLWRLSWLSLAWAVGLLAIAGDQYYLIGWKQRDLAKIELAANLFPLNRNVALGPALYYLVKNEPSEIAIDYLNKGLRYDPNAVDLLQSKVTYSLMLGKQNDATETYSRLIRLAPKLNTMDKIKNLK